jgi:hypothetical protein
MARTVLPARRRWVAGVLGAAALALTAVLPGTASAAAPAAASAAAPAAAAPAPVSTSVGIQASYGTLLLANQRMVAGQSMYTLGPVRLTLQSDGNLIEAAQAAVMWQTGTGGSNVTLTMQGDGNLVLATGTGRVLWATGTQGHPGAYLLVGIDGLLSVREGPTAIWTSGVWNNVLVPGAVLKPGNTLFSVNARARLIMQDDGYLVARGPDGRIVWNTLTGGNPGAYAVMQGDGYLVLRSATGKILWNTLTGGNPRAEVIIQPDGNPVLTSTNDTPLWWPSSSGAGVCNGTARDPKGDLVTRWNPIVKCVLVSLRQSTDDQQVADVDTIIRNESSGDPNAINLWDSNAKAGHPSIGLMQVIKPTFAYYRTTQLPDDQYNPAANIYAGINYAVHRYGSIHNVPGLVSLRSGGRYVGYSVDEPFDPALPVN